MVTHKLMIKTIKKTLAKTTTTATNPEIPLVSDAVSATEFTLEYPKLFISRTRGGAKSFLYPETAWCWLFPITKAAKQNTILSLFIRIIHFS